MSDDTSVLIMAARKAAGELNILLDENNPEKRDGLYTKLADALERQAAEIERLRKLTKRWQEMYDKEEI